MGTGGLSCHILGRLLFTSLLPTPADITRDLPLSSAGRFLTAESISCTCTPSPTHSPLPSPELLPCPRHPLEPPCWAETERQTRVLRFSSSHVLKRLKETGELNFNNVHKPIHPKSHFNIQSTLKNSLMRYFTFSFCTKSLKVMCILHTHYISIKTSLFQVLRGHLRLVATTRDSSFRCLGYSTEQSRSLLLAAMPSTTAWAKSP